MLRGTYLENAAVDMYRMQTRKRKQLTRSTLTKLLQGEVPPIFDVQVHSVGLTVDVAHPYLGASPDGIVDTNDPVSGREETILLEIKCPFSSNVPYAQQEKYRVSAFPGVPAGIPPAYYCQIQGCMAILRLPAADFVEFFVAPPDGTASAKPNLFIQRYDFKPEFWSGVMLPRLEAFYRDLFIPKLVAAIASKVVVA